MTRSRVRILPGAPAASTLAAVNGVSDHGLAPPAFAKWPHREPSDWHRACMRRFTGVMGAALVLLGFTGFLAEGAVESVAGSWLPVATLCLVPVGFVVMWEAQIVWPEDGAPYPWRRRLAGLTVGVATVAAAIVTRGVLATSLHDGWLAHLVATFAGVAAGDAVLRRLRRVFASRLGWLPPSSDSTAAD